MNRNWTTVLCQLAVPACASQVNPRLPTGPLERAPSGDWTHVHEPGWFGADLPAPPRESVRNDRYWKGAFQYKELLVDTSSQANGALCSIRYLELVDREDAEKVAGFAAERYEHNPPAGVSVRSTSVVDAGGSPAKEIAMRLEPGSAMNAAPIAVATRVRLLISGPRLFQLECSAPADQPATCDRFFVAFHLDRAP
jgi:hypothetical protein